MWHYSSPHKETSHSHFIDMTKNWDSYWWSHKTQKHEGKKIPLVPEIFFGNNKNYRQKLCPRIVYNPSGKEEKNLKTKLTNIVVERYLQCNHMYTEEIVNSDREHCRIFLIYSLWAGFKKMDCDKGSGKGSYSLRKHHGLIMEPRYWIRKTTRDNKVTKISMDWLVKRWNYTIIWGTRLFKALTMGVRIWI